MTAVFTDADNTLWDTDGVYRAAQLGLLRHFTFAERLFANDIEALGFVRRHDQQIASSHADGLRYPATLLAKAIAAELGHDSNDGRLIDQSIAIYKRLLDEIPPLRTGVREGIAMLHAAHGALTVVTETSSERCSALLEAHDLKTHVLRIVAGRKSSELYRSLRGELQGVMIGDQLDSDVLYSQAAGYETVYFPGNFAPFWIGNLNVTPDYVVESFADIPEVIGSSISDADRRGAERRASGVQDQTKPA